MRIDTHLPLPRAGSRPCSVLLPGKPPILLGYACQNLSLGRNFRALRLATFRAGGLPVLQAIVDHNLALLAAMLDWNRDQGIAMFRLSSDLVPLGSHEEIDAEALRIDPALQTHIIMASSGVRLSSHPGQFTVLSTPDPGVLARSLAELAFQARLLDRLGLAGGDMVLHGGGVYGDRPAASRRLAGQVAALPPPVHGRLCLENDERSWSVDDLLPICAEAGVPLVVDTFHHALYGRQPLAALPWERIAATWEAAGRRPKIHYSEQDPAKRPGAHSSFVTPEPFLRTLAEVGLPAFDVMLECKAKDRALLRLVAALEGRG